MSATASPVGKTFPPVTYAVGREKIREYALAVGETNPLHLDREAARAAGHADLVAPPMFVVVYAGPVLWPALMDPEVGIDFAHMVHGGQEFVWERLVIAGDEVTTECAVADISERGGLRFFVFETRSDDQEGERVCTGRWTTIVRAAE
jgi:acyl dehydratase